ncbi:2827_t:CDS:10 [Funneliformis caledonium]|uniref:2827_t:CDS:1 n=1 Tax=Funneliformis caledonium TaxID=1117310 RepID=A0A9N9CNT2_9GLOM|nr:2827_t:CDS:10 [Funneliformis caledonium]
MNKDLDLMFSLLQQEVEKFTAELACEDFDDLSRTNHKTLDNFSELDTGFNPVTQQETRLKKEPSISINNGYNSSEKSISNMDLRLKLIDTTLHQRSNSAESRESNHLSPESKINVSPSAHFSSDKLTSAPLNYSRLRSLSNSSNIQNLLRKQSSLTDLSNSSDNDQKSIISNENIFKLSHESKRIPATVGRNFGSSLKNVIDKDNVKSYNTHENLPLRPRMNSMNASTSVINLEESRKEKQKVRSRANSKVQDLNLDIYDSSVRAHLNKIFEKTDLLENSSRSLKPKERERSKERKSDDQKDWTGKSRDPEPRPRSSEIRQDEWEGREHRGENCVKGIRDHETDPREKAKSRGEPSRDIESEKMSQTNESRTRALEDNERKNARENLVERGKARSRVRGEEERGMTKSGIRGEEERGRGMAKSGVHGEDEYGRAKSRVRGEEERGRGMTKSGVHGEDERGRAKSRVRGEEEHGRAKSRVRGEDERGRARSKVRGEEERGRSKSKVRGEEERGRTKSKTHVEESGRAKSRTLEEERGRSKSKPREREVDGRNYNKESNKSRTHELWDKEKHYPYRREKAETFVDKEGHKITELKIITQIFIEDVRQYKKLSITSSKTALDVLNYFRSNDTIYDNETWTLFELINEYGLERPIRDWEYIATVIGAWELDKPNALVLKKHAFRSCLTLEGFNNAVPPMFGWLHLEIKKNKWQKRYFYTKEGVIYHSKDSKGNNETFLCSLTNFDVYTMTKIMKKSPTKFIFALKSQDKIAMFENPEKDYLHYLCADHLDKMKDWVFSLQASKNNLMRAENPERFTEKPVESEKTYISDNHDKEKPLTSENSTDLNANVNNGTEVSEKHRSNSQWENLRKHVRNSSSKSLKGKADIFVGTVSTANGDQPFKGGSLLDFDEKNYPIKPVEAEGVSFVKGSLLASNDSLFEQAKEREKHRKAMGGIGIIRDPNSTTFVNLDESVKFNKGSLLGRNNETVSENIINSNHLIQIEDGVQFNKGSLLTKVQESNGKNNNSQKSKPLGTLLKIDAPLSRSLTTHNILSPTMLANGKTLLELDLKADATHTLSLRNTNIKPLLSFIPREHDHVEETKSPRTFIKFDESETDSEYDSNDY